MHIPEVTKVRQVVGAYQKVVGGKSKLVFLPIPKHGQKTFVNCLWVFCWCEESKVALERYFKEAVKLYSSDWCNRVFKNNWPPLSLAVSKSAWDKVKKEVGVRLGQDGEVETVNKILDNHTPAVRRLMLEVGLDWVSSKVKKEVK